MDVQEAELASLQAQLTVALEDNATVAGAQARVHDTAALLGDLTAELEAILADIDAELVTTRAQLNAA
ncbi:MAG: hypothetical protein WA991_07990 [Ornithinimicrobium sp.]